MPITTRAEHAAECERLKTALGYRRKDEVLSALAEAHAAAMRIPIESEQARHHALGAIHQAMAAVGAVVEVEIKQDARYKAAIAQLPDPLSLA